MNTLLPSKSVTSRDNTLLKELRLLAHDNTAYRKLSRFWVEGEHLCCAALARGCLPVIAVFAESFWAAMPTMPNQLLQALHSATTSSTVQVVVIPDKLFDEISGLESPSRVGFVFELPQGKAITAGAASVILDRVQDAGNVGSILRSAAAFGFSQVLALKGTAALWSQKVLRAGMGAHFGLQFVEGLELPALDALHVPLVVTSSHGGELIHQSKLPTPCAWVLGHEGQGVRSELMARASLCVRIGQPGGEESLNVAAAAAICLHATSLN